MKRFFYLFLLLSFVLLSSHDIEQNNSGRVSDEVCVAEPYPAYEVVKKTANPASARKQTGDWEAIFYIVTALGGIVLGLISLGASVWLVIGVLAGLLGYLVFVGFLFVRFFSNGLHLEWYWWIILAALVVGGSFAAVWLVGINAVSAAIVSFMVYFAVGMAALAVVVMLIIAFFKALFRPFFRN